MTKGKRERERERERGERERKTKRERTETRLYAPGGDERRGVHGGETDDEGRIERERETLRTKEGETG